MSARSNAFVRIAYLHQERKYVLYVHFSLTAAESQAYGSLDRGLLRRSRGRKKPEAFGGDSGRDRQM